MFIAYSKENEWIRKEHQSYDYKDTFFTSKDELFHKIYKIDLNTDFEKFPYIDTFTYGGDGYLTNEEGRRGVHLQLYRRRKRK